MASTTPALFRFTIHPTPPNTEEPINIDHTHPVPTFLTHPNPSQQGSQDFTAAFIDVISIVTHQHHDECMAATTSPCLGCGKEAKDALKSPMSYLHLFEPMVIIQVTPVCGSAGCEKKVRAGLLQMQTQQMEKRKEEVWSGANFGKMGCAVCEKEDAKRCAGCGTVAYCSKE